MHRLISITGENKDPAKIKSYTGKVFFHQLTVNINQFINNLSGYYNIQTVELPLLSSREDFMQLSYIFTPFLENFRLNIAYSDARPTEILEYFQNENNKLKEKVKGAVLITRKVQDLISYTKAKSKRDNPRYLLAEPVVGKNSLRQVMSKLLENYNINSRSYQTEVELLQIVDFLLQQYNSNISFNDTQIVVTNDLTKTDKIPRQLPVIIDFEYGQEMLAPPDVVCITRIFDDYMNSFPKKSLLKVKQLRLKQLQASVSVDVEQLQPSQTFENDVFVELMKVCQSRKQSLDASLPELSQVDNEQLSLLSSRGTINQDLTLYCQLLNCFDITVNSSDEALVAIIKLYNSLFPGNTFSENSVFEIKQVVDIDYNLYNHAKHEKQDEIQDEALFRLLINKPLSNSFSLDELLKKIFGNSSKTREMLRLNINQKYTKLYPIYLKLKQTNRFISCFVEAYQIVAKDTVSISVIPPLKMEEIEDGDITKVFRQYNKRASNWSPMELTPTQQMNFGSYNASVYQFQELDYLL